MTSELLEKLGFSSKEILLYLTLVQRGSMTASELSAATKLNRTTAYSVISGLMKKNLITEDLGSPTAVYMPTPSANLIALFQKEENDARNKRELATRVAGDINKIAHEPFQPARITFIDEANIENFLTNRTPRWCQSLMHYDLVWRGFQDSRLLEHFPDYFKNLYEQGLLANITQELISEDQPAEIEFEKHHHFEKRKIKIWKHGYDFTYSTWVIGDYVIMIQAKDHPFYLIEIKDPALAKNLRELFSGLWTVTK